MTWKQVQKCLGVTDFSQSRDFIMQCPMIHNHVLLVAHKNAIKMGIMSHSNTNLKDTQATTDTDTASTFSSEKTLFLTPDMWLNWQKIQDLIHHIMPHLHKFSDKNPQDNMQDYARNCLTRDSHRMQRPWMSTTFATWEILKVCILKLSPPLKGKLTFTWIQDHMEYEILAATVTLNMDTPQTPPGTIASTISDASTWQQFHQLIFPLL